MTGKDKEGQAHKQHTPLQGFLDMRGAETLLPRGAEVLLQCD